MGFKIEWQFSDNFKDIAQFAAKYFNARAKYLKPAMDLSVDEVLDEGKSRIPVVTGSTQRSMGSKVIQGAGSTVGKITTSLRAPNLSPFVVNYGRKSGGKQPPSKKLEAWVSAKGLASGNGIARVAYVIARSIAKKGTKGVHFQSGSLNDKRNRIIDIHQQAVNSMVREMEK